MALILHAIFILGVGFTPEEKTARRFPSLDIILMQQRDLEKPEDADFLSQANLEGGGDSEVTDSPATPVTAPIPDIQPEMPAAQPQPTQPPPTPANDVKPTPDPIKATKVPEPAIKTIAVEKNTPLATKTVTAAPEQKAKPEPELQQAPESQPKAVTKPTLSAASLINRSFAMASLNAEINEKMESRAKRPRRKFISASTREYRFASYMESWRAKVERIGNLNYPDEARRKRLSGALIISVDINPDGTLKAITVRKSSGHKVLDDAAIRIIKLSAPFARFPDNIAKDVDILNITRTWKFLANNRFSRG